MYCSKMQLGNFTKLSGQSRPPLCCRTAIAGWINRGYGRAGGCRIPNAMALTGHAREGLYNAVMHSAPKPRTAKSLRSDAEPVLSGHMIAAISVPVMPDGWSNADRGHRPSPDFQRRRCYAGPHGCRRPILLAMPIPQGAVARPRVIGRPDQWAEKLMIF